MAAHTLAVGNGSFFILDNYPYPRGILPVFDKATGKLELRYSHNDLAPLMNSSSYSDILNAATGVPFVSTADLIAWVMANVYAVPGFGINKTYTIGTGGHNAGTTLTDAALIGAVPLSIMGFNGTMYNWAADGVMFNPATGTFNFAAATQNPNLANNYILTIL